MTAASNAPLSRRPLLIGALAVLGLGAAGLFAYELPALVRSRYAPTPFDDLLAKLPDRENAARIGSAALGRRTSFDASAAATRLRSKLRSNTLRHVLATELERGELAEVRGWVLPRSLVVLCALAAKENQPRI